MTLSWVNNSNPWLVQNNPVFLLHDHRKYVNLAWTSPISEFWQLVWNKIENQKEHDDTECNNLNPDPKKIIYHSKCGDKACLAKQIKSNREAYVFLNAARPRVGKLSKPQESPTPLKNHLKQLQKKLMLRYFPRLRTCFLQQMIR